jgi:hypothetical protein
VVAKDGTMLATKGTYLTKALAAQIDAADVESVAVRSPLTCTLGTGICQKCYGADVTTWEPVDLGEAVGTVAAQAIGEPGTQLTMNTKHAGGAAAAGGDVVQGLPRVEEVFERRTPKSPAILATISGVVSEIQNLGNEKVVKILPDEGAVKGGKVAELSIYHPRMCLVKEGQRVEKGDFLSDGSADLTDLNKLAITPGERAASALLEDFLPRIGRYREARDYPAIKGPSYLSVHLRFGTVPIRRLVREARHAVQSALHNGPDEPAAEGARTWLSELIWRDFYFQILHHHPRVEHQSFKAEYERIEWEGGETGDALFAAWCEGRTGYPLIDAAIAQIRSSGYMHNRLRMVTASFLCKDLGIDWRRGERWFAQHLNDYDLSANNGGWQWASSSGCDAQPYFRIFNPITQSQKFDPQGQFIRRYLPQLAGLSATQVHAPWLVPLADQVRLGCVIGRDYPAPVVDHAQARLHTLMRYSVVKTDAGR